MQYLVSPHRPLLRGGPLLRRTATLAPLAALVALAAATWASPVAAQTLSAYDTFVGVNLNATKWYGDEGRTYGGIRAEAHRSVEAGQARIELRTWGDTTSNSGFSSSRNSLVAVKSPTITAMRGLLTMRGATLTPCATNTTQPTIARARMFGFFFNAGDAVAGSNFNDVFAGVQLSRASNTTDAANIFRVSGFAGVCSDDSCIASTSLGSVDLGTVALNTAVQLLVSWDAANSRFKYQRGTEAAQYLSYTVSDALVASFPVKRLEVSNLVPRCVGGTRPTALTSADFDSIYVNSTALSAARGMIGAADETAGMERVDPATGPLN